MLAGIERALRAQAGESQLLHLFPVRLSHESNFVIPYHIEEQCLARAGG
jgi:hypothetical protein